MAYWIQKTGTNHNSSNYRYFMCDYCSDIERLPRYGIRGELQEGDTVSSAPCSYGSECLCKEDSSVWGLGKDTNEWTKLSCKKDDSSYENMEFATIEDIEKMFI